MTDIIKDNTTNLPIQLDEFKQYAVETSSHRDAEMTIMLLTAIDRVERHCNCSLCDHEITLIQDRKVLNQKLYCRPVKEIKSVTDLYGLELDYKTDVRKRTIELSTPSAIIVNYTTEAKVEPRHKQAILDYATLLYNGYEGNVETANVLLKCELSIL